MESSPAKPDQSSRQGWPTRFLASPSLAMDILYARRLSSGGRGGCVYNLTLRGMGVSIIGT